MILRILVGLFLIAICYFIYRTEIFLKVPGFGKFQSFYSRYSDICDYDFHKQFMKTKGVVQDIFDLQCSILSDQFEKYLRTINVLNQKIEINIGKVVMVSPDKFPQQFFVSLGLGDGVQKYSFVIKDGFLFGRVVNVGQDMSEVLTVFSPMFYVDVIFLGIGARAILQGDLTGRMKVFATYGSLDFERVPPNTVLVTAGSKNNSPFGIPVAYVSQDKSIIALADYRDTVYLGNIVEFQEGR